MPQTYFHVGYARAASTFLQKTVFPALKGIQYIPRNNFRVRESEKKRFKGDKILMSREAGEFIFERCDEVQKTFNSKIIISVRRHDVLAASTYRLYAKNGHTFRHNAFLDIDHNDGVRKLEDFNYMRLIKHVEQTTGEKPLLLIFEDFINDQDFYIDSLCAFLECDIDRSKLTKKAVHKSYTDKQLRLRRQFSEKFNSPEENQAKLKSISLAGESKWQNFKQKLLVRVSGIFMRLVKFAPDSWLNDEPLLIDSHSKAIRDYFADDWDACYEYVEKQSLDLGVTRNVEVKT